MDGLVVVDKPGGMTSHDVVARVRRLARTRRVGHGGTLDPMATGVLVSGRTGDPAAHLRGRHDKSYIGTVRLGESTVTDDAEGEVTADARGRRHRGRVRAALAVRRRDRPGAERGERHQGGRASAPTPGPARARRSTCAPPVSRSPGSTCAPWVEGTATIDVDVDLDLLVRHVHPGHRPRPRCRARRRRAPTALRRTAVGGFTLAEAVTLEELCDGRAARGDPAAGRGRRPVVRPAATSTRSRPGCSRTAGRPRRAGPAVRGLRPGRSRGRDRVRTGRPGPAGGRAGTRTGIGRADGRS